MTHKKILELNWLALFDGLNSEINLLSNSTQSIHLPALTH